MTRLLLRVMGAIALSLVFSFMWVSWIIRPGTDQMPPPMFPILLGAGLGHYYDELQAAAPEDREQRMAELSAIMTIPARLSDRSPEGHMQPWVDSDSWTNGSIFLPLSDAVIEVGPFPLPRPSVLQGSTIALGVTLIVVLAAGLVVLPISSRLQRIEHALERFRAGDLSVRLTDTSPDAVGKMALGFNHMAGALEQRIRRQEELLQAVSHEYGTPLARLALRTEMLARRLPPEHGPRLDDLRKDLAALDLLTAELVSFVVLDAPDPAQSRLHDLDTLISETVDEESLYGKPVTLLGSTRRTPPGRPEDLRRCLANVVRNAQRYAATQVWVTVHEEDALYVHVDDDGPGIPPTALEHVFEPFARLEASRDRKTGGVGLGLAIARRCAIRLGGTLVASGSPYGGARITLMLPGG